MMVVFDLVSLEVIKVMWVMFLLWFFLLKLSLEESLEWMVLLRRREIDCLFCWLRVICSVWVIWFLFEFW